jgi:anti-sigma B factor antagonist
MWANLWRTNSGYRGSVLVDVQVHEEGGWTIVSVVGELDLAVAPRVRQVVVAALDPGRGVPQVVLDLGSVHFVDSSGLGVVLGVLRRVRQAGGTLRVVAVESQVVGLFELLGLDTIIDIRPSVDDATSDPVVAAPTTLGSGGASGG